MNDAVNVGNVPELCKNIVVSIGIMIRSGTVLICRRKPEAVLGSYWEFPGGKVEPGESAETAVVREISEELGVAVEVIERLLPITHVYPHGVVQIHPFLCRLIAGEPQAIDCAEWRWIPAADLVQYPFPPANEGLLRTLTDHPLLQAER